MKFKNTTDYMNWEKYVYYTIIPEHITYDSRLNTDAKHIMTCVLSNDKEKWIINRNQVKRISNIGEKSFRKAWEQLKKCNYITQTRLQGRYHYTINAIPTDVHMYTCGNGTFVNRDQSEQTEVPTGSCQNVPSNQDYLKNQNYTLDLKTLDTREGGQNKETPSKELKSFWEITSDINEKENIVDSNFFDDVL